MLCLKAYIREFVKRESVYANENLRARTNSNWTFRDNTFNIGHDQTLDEYQKELASSVEEFFEKFIEAGTLRKGNNQWPMI